MWAHTQMCDMHELMGDAHTQLSGVCANWWDMHNEDPLEVHALSK
jgi:hypothetical protein